MVDITYQMVLSTLQTVSLMIGVIYYIFIMRNSQRTRELTLQSQELTRKAQEQALETRQAQLFNQLTDKFSSKEGLDYLRVLGEANWSSYEEWLEMIRNDVEYIDAYRWLYTVFNSRGVLLSEGLLDIRLIALMASGPSIYWCEKYQDVIYNERKRLNDSRHCSAREHSVKLLVKYLEEHPELKT